MNNNNNTTITTSAGTIITSHPLVEVLHKGYATGPRIWQTQRVDVVPADGVAYSEEHSYWREGSDLRLVRVTTRRIA